MESLKPHQLQENKAGIWLQCQEEDEWNAFFFKFCVLVSVRKLNISLVSEFRMRFFICIQSALRIVSLACSVWDLLKERSPAPFMWFLPKWFYGTEFCSKRCSINTTVCCQCGCLFGLRLSNRRAPALVTVPSPLANKLDSQQQGSCRRICRCSVRLQ